MTRLILIRHGETDWNVEGRYQGQADPPLNARGLAQAQELARRLGAAGLHVLYSSPLRRAWQTAQVLARVLGLPLFPEPRLQEICLGEWEGRLTTRIAADYPDQFSRWQTQPWSMIPPNGEHLSAVRARVYAAVDAILRQHVAQTIGLVTHRIPIVLLEMRYQGLGEDAVRTLELPNAYWAEFEIPEDR